MKSMISLLLSLLLIAVLMVLMLKQWTGGEEPDDGAAPSARFLRRCRELAPARAPPAAYCRCLWSNGVRKMTQTVSDPKAQQTSRSCAERSASDPPQKR